MGIKSFPNTPDEASVRLSVEECRAQALTAIAVVGIGCRYPGANDLCVFWENVLARRRQFRRIPDCRLPLGEYHDPDPLEPDKTYGTRAALVDGFEFDWKKRFVPKLAYESADMAHWLALDTALRALADAGLSRETVLSERSGVVLGNTLTGEQTRATAMRQRWPFVARSLRAAARARGLPSSMVAELEATMKDYFQSVFAPTTEHSLTGGLSNTIAGRICNHLNLHGGGYTVDGACASSLLAVATAANALVNGELDFVLAGGVDVSLDTFELIGFAKVGALTPNDMSVYDRKANGFIPGEGCGFVALKRLDDARAAGERVYAVLRGWGISSDGKGGLTAPSREGQARALRRAYARAGYSASNVDFFEGHGTGTTVGDRVELEGIALALGEPGDAEMRAHGVTSLKSLVGHTKAAAGIGGFIKAAVAVNRRIIPPTAGCQNPNAVFEEPGSTIYPVLTGEQRPTDSILRAGVSAMGFGGINCHVTLESGDPPVDSLSSEIDERALMAHAQDAEIFVFSGKTPEELLHGMDQTRSHVFGASLAEMADLAAQLGAKTHSRPWRAAAIAATPDELFDRLAELASTLQSDRRLTSGGWRNAAQTAVLSGACEKPRLAFVFPGQGSQQLGMARALIERHAWARALFADAERWLCEVGAEPLGPAMFPPLERAPDSTRRKWAEKLGRTEMAQPAICVASLLWLRYLERLGLKPDVVGGHSLGELTALHAAGAFSAETLVKLAARRGSAMAAPAGEAGGMVSLACDAEAARDLIARIDGDLTVANLNSPRQTVVSGASAAIEAIVAISKRFDIRATMLPVSNAFHSRFVASAEAAIRTSAATPATAARLDVTVVSGVDGCRLASDVDLREHLARQITAPVDFVALARRLAQEADQIVEVGPGQALCGLLRDTLKTDGALPIASRPDVWRDLLRVLARAFSSGYEIDWSTLYADRLIRPFAPASEKIFFDNPCERPFRPKTEWGPPRGKAGSAVLADGMDVDAKALEEYLTRRGKLLGNVIRADLDSAESAPPKSAVALKENAKSFEPKPAPQIAALPTAEARLVNIVAAFTGFPAESISHEMHLLDDLNLESTQAAELVASAAKAAGVAGALDASSFANASISEIAAAIEAAKAASGVVETRAAVPSAMAGGADVPLPEWVRCFSIAFAPEALAVTGRQDWIGASVLILHEVCDTHRAEALRAALMQAGAGRALRQSFAESDQAQSVDDPTFTHLIAFLPSVTSAHADLSECVRRLHMLTRSPRTPESGAPRGLGIVQFGGGFFGAGLQPAGLDQIGAAAFAASLHLERSELKVRVVDADATLASPILAECVLSEFSSGGGFVRAGYDAQGLRRVPRPRLEEPADWPGRGVNWSIEDVLIVTGGARGITAECALAFARSTGVRLALVGSSAPDDEITSTLERFRVEGLTARYYSCDVSDSSAVANLVIAVRGDLGEITAVIHGAAINKPRRAEQSNASVALSEVRPKVQGVLNLIEALADARLKIFVGFTSIIGVTGMPGNSWYAFSNELLDCVLRRFRVAHPDTQVISMAFSVWSGVGMGARDGSVHRLARRGTGVIPPKEGVERFLALIERDPGDAQIVVTAPLGGLDTWEPAAPKKPIASRYLDEVKSFTPGVDLRVRAHIDLAHDPYVADHVYKGSVLFPAVFGLEAMAQAAAWVTSRNEIDAVVIEDIRLERRIVVDQSYGETIELHARVEERRVCGGPQRVEVTISTKQNGFGVPHFAASYVFDAAPTPPVSTPPIDSEALAIEPLRDLYGWLLFQGPRFQRLRSVHRLNSRECVLFAEARNDAASEGVESYLLGDPFFRDALLQSAQLTVPRHLSLPVHIDRMILRALTSRRCGQRKVEAVFDGFSPGNSRRLFAHVTAFDDRGGVLEEIYGYTLAVVEHRPDHPTPEQMASPEDYDAADLRRLLDALAAQFDFCAPWLAVAHGRWHALGREERREAELPYIYAVLRAAGATGARVKWLDSGRPVVSGADDIAVSLAHDDATCLVVAGAGRQGCDLAPVVRREGMDDWRALLGDTRMTLLAKLVAEGEALDVAGARLWAAVEVLRKANASRPPSLDIRGRSGDGVLFESEGSEGGCLSILTFPWRGLRGPEKIVAITLSPKAPNEDTRRNVASFDYSAFEGALDVGPQGQTAFKLRFPLSFREIACASRRLYFSNYFAWMGRLREAACRPVYDALVAHFSTGSWGMVTNKSETRVLGDAQAEDVIEGRLWLEGVSGSEGSEMKLCYEWTAERPDGRRELVARSRMTATWVEVLDHGVVRARPFPHYFQGLMDYFSQRSGDGGEFNVGGRPDLGQLLRQAPPGPARETLCMNRYETSLQDSNLVGNIYFSNYYVWQGHTVDRFFKSLVPAAFRTVESGEFFCAYSRVEHLREAMPFDTIVVKMSLAAVFENGVRLALNYFHENEDGGLSKLAWGEHDSVWTEPDGSGLWRQAPLPEHVVKALLGHLQMLS